MQYKTKLLSILALLLAAVQGARADETKTVLEDGVFTGFTATAGSNTGDGGYDKLVDGNTGTKWCTNASPFYVEFHSSGLIVPKGYILTTAGDTQSYSTRNPKSWTIKAKVNAGDSWTTLVTVTDDTSMPAANTTPVEFTISGNTTAYRYFRLDVSATRSGSWFQLSEFQFVGTTTDTGNITVKPSLSGLGTSESPFTIGSADDWSLFAGKVNNDGKTYSGKYVKLTENIEVTTKCGTVSGTSQQKAFSGTFDGGGHTITANITDTDNQGTALFAYIDGATIKNLTVGGTVSGTQHVAAIVGFSKGTCSIENCKATATINCNDTHMGGIMGHALDSNISVSGCVFSGLMTGGSTAKGALVGWGDSGTKSVTDCLYLMADGQNTDGLDLVKGNGTVTVTNCYKTTSAGTYGTQVYTSAPADDVTKQITAVDGHDYYAACTVSGVKGQYRYTGSPVTIVPTVTYNGETLTEGTNYTVSTNPATVQALGDYTLNVTGLGDYTGTKTIHFTMTEGTPVTSETTSLTEGVYAVYQDVTISSRIQISGDVILVLREGTTLTASKGIELSQGNTLTIEGPGALTINDCDSGKSGIGANWVGTLVINGGTINVTGGQYGAGIGGDVHNSSGGTITINGGVVNATGGDYAAGIGGGYDDQFRQHTFCGDIYINGGQVTVTAGIYACGIGPGYAKSLFDWGNGIYEEDRAYYSGSLTLSWTSVDDDFVNINRLVHEGYGADISSITIADGKKFIIGETTIDSNTTDLINKLNGKIIWPYGQGGDIVLTDDKPYIRTGSIPVTSATYRKTTDRVGLYHSWLVPFDHTITATDAEKFTFYKLYMIANAIAPDATMTDEMWLYVRPMAEGDMLHANMPYLYVPLEAVTDYEFTTANAMLKAKATDAVATMQTMENTFTIYGTYGPTSPSATDQFYYMSANNNLSLGTSSSTTVGAFRWIMRVENKFGSGSSSPAYAPSRILIYDGESDDVTGIQEVNEVIGVNEVNDDSWYTLDGRKLNGKPAARGIYVVNGKKVVIK